MKLTRQTLLRRAEKAFRESKHVDFKSEFDAASGEAWCELIKDIAAFANSGGGVIVFGVADDGTDAQLDLTSLLAYDTADITNRIARYTNYQFSEFEIVEITRSTGSHPAFLIYGVDILIIFTKPGTYDIGGGKQKTAFSQGTVYFRHGSKSEPGIREDFVAWRDREIARVRATWLGGIRKVVETNPDNSVVIVSSSTTQQKQGAIVTARLTSDPSAVPLVPGNTGELWPHRQVDLIREVNKRLGPGVRINTYDIQCIKTKIRYF